MKALTWHGKGDIRSDSVPDPNIVDGSDAMGSAINRGLTFRDKQDGCIKVVLRP